MGAPSLAFPQSLDDLKALQDDERSVWVLYSFTRDMRRFWPKIYGLLRSARRNERRHTRARSRDSRLDARRVARLTPPRRVPA